MRCSRDLAGMNSGFQCRCWWEDQRQFNLDANISAFSQMKAPTAIWNLNKFPSVPGGEPEGIWLLWSDRPNPHLPGSTTSNGVHLHEAESRLIEPVIVLPLFCVAHKQPTTPSYPGTHLSDAERPCSGPVGENPSHDWRAPSMNGCPRLRSPL